MVAISRGGGRWEGFFLRVAFGSTPPGRPLVDELEREKRNPEDVDELGIRREERDPRDRQKGSGKGGREVVGGQGREGAKRGSRSREERLRQAPIKLN